MTIKEVAEKFELTPDTLRFYEKEGLIGPIKKKIVEFAIMMKMT